MGSTTMLKLFVLLFLANHPFQAAASKTVELSQCSIQTRPITTTEAPRCGKVFTTDTGEIIYRPNYGTANNERCVWLIAAPTAWSYDITFEHIDNAINQPGGSQVLLITDETFTSYMPLGKTVDQIWSRVLTITFATGENVAAGTGFTIKYKADNKVNNYPEQQFHQIFTHPVYNFRYPDKCRYKANEISVSVFPQAKNFYSESERRLINAGLRVRGDGKDVSLVVSKFRFSTIYKGHSWWSPGVVISDPEGRWNQEFHTDIMVSVFRSKRDIVGNASWVQYV